MLHGAVHTARSPAAVRLRAFAQLKSELIVDRNAPLAPPDKDLLGLNQAFLELRPSIRLWLRTYLFWRLRPADGLYAIWDAPSDRPRGPMPASRESCRRVCSRGTPAATSLSSDDEPRCRRPVVALPGDEPARRLHRSRTAGPARRRHAPPVSANSIFVGSGTATDVPVKVRAPVPGSTR